MKNKLILLVSFLFCVPAFGQDSSQDYESDPSYDYSCSLRSVSTRSKDFYSRQEALDWCSQFGKFCVARRGDYRGWQGFFERKFKFDFKSDQSWSHARGGTFKGYQDFLGQNNYYHQDFRHQFRFDRCY